MMSSRCTVVVIMICILALASNDIKKVSAEEDLYVPYNRIGLTPILLAPDTSEFLHTFDEEFRELSLAHYDDNKVPQYVVNVDLPIDWKLKERMTYEEIKQKIEEKREEKEQSEAKDSDNDDSSDAIAKSIARTASQAAIENIGDRLTTHFDLPEYDKIVKEQLNENNIAHKVIDSLYQIDENGIYSMDRLLERARFNLSDVDAQRLESTYRGFEENVRDMQWTNSILTSNYIMTLYIHDIVTMEEYYEEEDTNPEDRKLTGYKGDVVVSIYRIDLNDSVRAEFYDKAWAGANSTNEEIERAIEMREKMHYPIEKIDEFQFTTNSRATLILRDDISNERRKGLYQNLFSNAFKDAYELAEENIEAFQVQSSVLKYETSLQSNVFSRIGTREGLSSDDRYFVYENVMGSDGEVDRVRRGVIRASTDVAENDTIVAGDMEPSRFVQTSGRELDHGMLIMREPDKGYALTFGIKHHSSLADIYNIRFEHRFGGGSLSPGWQLYGEVGIHENQEFTNHATISFQTSNQSESFDKTNLNAFSLGGGVSKDIYLAKNLQISPYLGLRLENNRFKEDELHEYLSDKISNYGRDITVDAGTRVGINLFHWLRLTGAVGISPVSFDSSDSFFGEDLHPELANVVDGQQYTGENPFHQKRNTVIFDLGMRFSW